MEFTTRSQPRPTPPPTAPAVVAQVRPKPEARFYQKYTSKLKWLTKIRPRRISRRTFIILLVVAVIAVYVILRLPHQPTQSSGNLKSDPQLKNATGSLVKGTPSYTTVLPAGKSIADLGGWTRVSPPDRNEVYAFPDKLADTPIIVSEQPMPKDFRSDTEDQMAELAKGYSATRYITAGNIRVYVGTSAKGPQSVIFTTNNLLVLIKASAAVADEDWKTYISQLR